jgi:hypothetical protein
MVTTRIAAVRGMGRSEHDRHGEQAAAELHIHPNPRRLKLRS